MFISTALTRDFLCAPVLICLHSWLYVHLWDCDCMWAHASTIMLMCGSMCVCVSVCANSWHQDTLTIHYCVSCLEDVWCLLYSLSVSLTLRYSLHATQQPPRSSGTLPELALSFGCLVCLVNFFFFTFLTLALSVSDYFLEKKSRISLSIENLFFWLLMWCMCQAVYLLEWNPPTASDSKLRNTEQKSRMLHYR